MNPRLVLFDIDQTLINTTGCGRRAMEKALHDVFGVQHGLSDLPIHGKTDPLIIFEALESHGLAQALTSNKDHRFWERHLFHLKNELAASSEPYIHPGVTELLESLDKNPDVFLGLLTGNIQRGAQVKLEHFGLWKYFPVGGFGSDHMDRNVVAKIAAERSAKHYNKQFAPEQIFVIGDSLRDIACAHAIQAKAVAVATGQDAYELLASKKPYALFNDLADTQKVLDALNGGTNHA